MKYIVSACLAGDKCRYDGNSNTIDNIRELVENGSALSVCPEILGGLTVPRPRCELRRKDNGSAEIIGEDNNDYTDNFIRGAILSLEIAREKGITQAILKSKSPSCGCGIIYDGTFTGKLSEGNGVTAELFLKSGITIFTEEEFFYLEKSVKAQIVIT